MRILRIGSRVFTAGCLAVFLVWRIAGTLPDWAALAAGVGLLAGIVVLSLSAVPRKGKEDGKK